MPAALTAATLWTLDRIGAVSVAPDGRSAVVLVTHPDAAHNRTRTALWRLDLAGRAAPRRLTTAAGRVAQPAFSPRGDRIAFLATREQDDQRDETQQLYLLDIDGGEARRVCSFAPGFEAFRWLPDGRGVLASAWVWPELRGARAQAARWKAFNARKASGYATSEAQYRQWDHHHPTGRVLHLLQVDVASGRVTDLFEGSDWQLPREATTPEPFDAAADGRIVFCFDPATERRNGNRLALAMFDPASRRVRVLLDAAAWSVDQPRWSPDGQRLAVLTAEVGRVHTAPLRPALVEPGTRGVRWRPLGQHWDHEASSPPLWAADGRSLLFTAESRGRCLLWRCTPEARADAQADGHFEPLTDSGWVQAFDATGAAASEHIVIVQDSAAHPPCAQLLRPGRPPRRLERFNDRALARVAFGPTEETSIPGALGDTVQMWLTYPPGFERRRRHPVLQVIHGGPHIASGDSWNWRWNAHVLASQGHVVVQVNYHGSSGFGHAFRHSIMGRLAQLESTDIEAATDWLQQQRWADPRRIYAGGGSYGGFLSAWINAHAAPGRYRAMVCHAGVFDRVATFAADSWADRARDLGAWYWEDMPRVLAQSPHAHAAGLRTPTLVTHGALDYRVPDANGFAYFHTLKALGVDARLLWFPDENHWVLKPANSLQWHEEVFAWLARHGR